MKKIRDSQRSKVYAAEKTHSQHTGDGQLSMDEMISLVGKTLSKLTKDPHPLVSHPVRVEQIYFHDGGGRRNAAAGWNCGMYSQPTMFMPRWSRSPLVTLHELAHILTGAGTAEGDRHNWRFCAVYLYLVKLSMGGKAEYELYRCFKKGRVQFRDPALKKKRTLTPERRAQLVATLAAAREKRKQNKLAMATQNLEAAS